MRVTASVIAPVMPNQCVKALHSGLLSNAVALLANVTGCGVPKPRALGAVFSFTLPAFLEVDLASRLTFPHRTDDE